MSPVRLPETETKNPVVKSQDRKLSGIGATEDQMDMRGAIAQRIDKKGTKIEDLAGVGGHDSSGG